MKKYILFTFISCLALQAKSQTVTDADGNVYYTVTIGTQVWMKENLKTTKFNDGTTISNVIGASEWLSLSTPAYCWYDNNPLLYKASYGAIYNWYTIGTGKLCPAGWHVATNEDWDILIDYLGGGTTAVLKMKEAGNSHWEGTNTATNSSGFTALPAGLRHRNIGEFLGIGVNATWWTSTENDALTGYYMDTDGTNLYPGFVDKFAGNSIRCIKDISTSVYTSDNSEQASFYPNPASEILYLKNCKSSTNRIVISDLQGKILLNSDVNVNYIDISKLISGIYLVKIIDTEYAFISTFIKN